MTARPAAAPRPSRIPASNVALYGLLAAVALICGYVEALVPLPVPVPGIKLGLGNVVVLFALAAFGAKSGLVIMLVKVVASAMLFGNPAVFAYSLAGGLASFGAMCLAARCRALTVVGVSMVGGVCHMLGQSLVVAMLLAPYVALGYAPVLVVSGLVAGLLTGYVCRFVIRTVGGSSHFARQRRLMRARVPSAAPAPSVAPAPLKEEP